jgi:murein DD-endopeptidase MepM/ murein hydrolase activator NlpD
MERRRFVLTALAFGLGGCAVVTDPNNLARTVRIADRLVGHRDAGPLDERELLALLRDVGVLTPSPSPRYVGAYGWPLQRGLVTSEFGPRWGTLHQGIDIAADAGVPVHASAPGEVVHSGPLGSYGNLVVLRHDARTTTLYAHNRALRVRAGQRVRQGQVVAALGSTGRSTGPHVHFEVREGERPIDPRRRLPARPFGG